MSDNTKKQKNNKPVDAANEPAPEAEAMTAEQAPDELTDNAAPEAAQPDTAADDAAQDEPTPEPTELERTQAELEETKDRLLRTAAEYENFRKRSEREKAAAGSLGIVTAAEKLLPVLDTLELAAAADSTDAEYKKGVEMTVTVFKNALAGLGIEEIEAEGKPFDPAKHNAVSREASDLESGTVVRVMQKGYKMGDRVVRFSIVSVAE